MSANLTLNTSEFISLVCKTIIVESVSLNFAELLFNKLTQVTMVTQVKLFKYDDELGMT